MNNKLIKLIYRRKNNFKKIIETATNIPLSFKDNRTLSKIKEIVMKHLYLLHINPNLAEIFQNSPILAFLQNKNLRDIIGTKLIDNRKVKRIFTNKIQGKCTPYLAKNRTLCAVNKLYIQQRLEATKQTEYFTSIIT